MTDPMIVRLANGEELIGYINPDKEVIWIKDPAVMFFDKDGLHLYKYLPYAKLDDKGLPLKNERIDWIVEPDMTLAVNYSKWHFDVIQNPGQPAEEVDLEFAEPAESGLKLVEP